MKNILSVLTVVGLMLAGNSNIYSQSLEEGSFVIKRDKVLNVTYEGRPLIVRDRINYMEVFGYESFHKADKLIFTQKEDRAAINVIKEKSNALQYRKEVALDKDGMIELNVTMKLFPWKNTPDKPFITYSFYIPLTTLEGATWKALVGRMFAPKVTEGKITSCMPDGPVTGHGRTRYIAFQSDEVNLVFDFNPLGVQAFGDYCVWGEPVGAWGIERQGNYIRFSFGFYARFYGGVFAAKVLIREGEWDWEERHAHSSWHWAGATEAHHQFSFGTLDYPEGFTGADTKRYSPERGWGWEKETGLSLVSTNAKDIIKNCVFSPDGRENTFIVDVTPGIYVITLRIGNKERDTGPFDVYVNEERYVENIFVKRGEIERIIFATYIRRPENQIRIRFRSEKNWSVNSLVLQAVIYQTQDFAFDRGLWVVEGLFLPGGFCFTSSVKAAEEGLADFKPVREVLLPPDTDELDWRWHMRMASFTTSIAGNRNELNTYELIERRIKELKDAGHNTIIMSGLHFHHCFLHRWDMWTRNVKKIVEVAHRHGIKVVEHHDVPVIFYTGTGYHFLLEHLEWLQRCIKFDNVTLRIMCLNHPDFRRTYLARLEKFARETKIDGVMLDECQFAEKEFCGCPYCREKFTRDTGYVLPLYNSSEVFFNKESPLWIAWLEWRKKSIGDWWIDVRRTLDRVNPNISILIYATHGGLTHRWAPLHFGVCLLENARACDFLGTEIMSRNVLDSFRAVKAYRKIFSALGNHFNSPIFALVYHLHDANFAYFGWALCRMNRQTTWMMTIEGADMGKYMDWPYQMKNRYAESLADIAILFSAYSRDFGRMLPHAGEALGFSQTLTAAHIQHDFLLDGDITVEKLKEYNLLILPASGNMSEEQVEAVREFVAGGGNLIVSGHSSLFNEHGFGGENFQLADIMGVDYVKGFIRPPHYIQNKSDLSIVPSPVAAVRVRVRDSSKSKVIANIVDENGNYISPALVITGYGKGKSMYLASILGAPNREPESTAGRKWTFEKNEEIADLLIDIVKMAVDDSFLVRAVNIPERVLLTVYKQNYKGQEDVLVHLLNATGAKELEKGDIVPGRDDARKAFPELKGDLVFDIRLDNTIRKGFIVSPDYKERREIGIEKKQDGYYRITISREDLIVYAIVYLRF